jgi:hypothetical protein
MKMGAREIWLLLPIFAMLSNTALAELIAICQLLIAKTEC